MAPNVKLSDIEVPQASGQLRESIARLDADSAAAILTEDILQEIRQRQLSPSALRLAKYLLDSRSSPDAWSNLSTNSQIANSQMVLRASADEGQVVEFGEVKVRFAGMEIWRSGKLIDTTAKEFKTVAFMVQNSGRVVSRDELLNRVWGYRCYPSTRTVDTHILRLRKKLELDPAHPRHFVTVHGVGYKFVP
jgi:DNA-binding response OmpR family regulator